MALHLDIIINMHSNAYQCYLDIRQDTLHGVRSIQSQKGKLKHAILGRLKKGSLSKKRQQQKAASYR